MQPILVTPQKNQRVTKMQLFFAHSETAPRKLTVKRVSSKIRLKSKKNYPIVNYACFLCNNQYWEG